MPALRGGKEKENRSLLGRRRTRHTVNSQEETRGLICEIAIRIFPLGALRLLLPLLLRIQLLQVKHLLSLPHVFFRCLLVQTRSFGREEGTEKEEEEAAALRREEDEEG